MTPAAERVALLSVLASALLAISKIAIGVSAHSVSTVSDGIESAGDVLTSSLVWFGLRVAAKPPDEDHPYGHGRFEILTGLAVGVFLVLAGAGICWRSFELRREPGLPELYALWPLLGSVLVKSVFAFIKMRIGRKTRSAGLIADAWNDTVDILSGSVAAGAVLLSIFMPGGMPAADHYGGFAIGLIVLFLAMRTIHETTLQLMDTMPDGAQMAEIRAATVEVPGALGIEKCFARKTGLRYHVDLHLEVDPDLTVRASHEIASRVRDHVRGKIEWVEDVLIHVEPHGEW